MQLTPRGLVMAASALLVGGAVFGVIGTLAPSPTVAGPNPTPSGSASWTDAELGDQVTTYPTSGASSPTIATSPASASASALPATVPPTSVPTPTTSVSAPLPTPAPSATASSPRPTDTARTAAHATPRATPRATASPRPIPTTTRRPAPRPAPRAPRQTAKAAAARGGWSAPALHIGANDVRPPSLTSGASVQVTVACSPSRACLVSGSDLVIDPIAESVTVTWSAPARSGYRAWSVSRGL